MGFGPEFWAGVSRIASRLLTILEPHFDASVRKLYAKTFRRDLDQLDVCADEQLKYRKLFGLSKELREKCEVIIDLGPDNEKYEKEWAKIGAK